MAFSSPSEIIGRLGVAAGSKVLDMGTGSGAYAHALADVVGSNGHVYIVDVQKELLSRVVQSFHDMGLRQVTGIWGDIERPQGTKLKEKSIQAIVLANVMFQIQDKPAVVREILRVADPDAKILLVEWSDSHGGIGPHPEHLFPVEEAVTFFKNHGFLVEEPFDSGDHHYGCIMTIKPLAQ